MTASVFLLAACQKATEAGTASSQSQRPVDRITLPEATREFASPSGRFVLVVSARDGWKTPRVAGELFSVTGSTRTPLWSRDLPQEYGPRFALVNDLGTSVLLDQWIRVKTSYAVLILDRGNRQLAQHSTDAVQAALQVPMKDVIAAGKLSWWIQAPPTLDPPGDVVLVPAAGKALVIRVDTGSLSAR